jgi:hypothetical protein
MHEFQYGKALKIFLSIFLVGLTVLFIWLSFQNIKLIWISIIVIPLLIAGFIDLFKSKFVIDQDCVYTVGVLGKRMLMFDDIRGYRVDDKYIYIFPFSGLGKKTVKVSLYMKRHAEIVDWLDSHYTDLDAEDVMEEQRELLNNDDFGETLELRTSNLAQAKTVARILNIAGVAVFVWLFLLISYYYVAAIFAAILLPIVCLFAIKYFKGLIKIVDEKKSLYPNILWAFIAPSTGLCLRALKDFNIFDYSNVWVPMLMITLLMVVVNLLIIPKKIKKVEYYFGILGFALLMAFYSFGVVAILNTILDKSDPEIFRAEIKSKHIGSGKSKTAYFELSPWSTRKEVEDEAVSKALYNQLNEKDSVSIYFHPGYFKIPWFIITE